MFITSLEEQNITYRSCSNFRIHLSFEQEELLQSVLLKVKNKMMTMDQAMEDLESLVDENE